MSLTQHAAHSTDPLKSLSCSQFTTLARAQTPRSATPVTQFSASRGLCPISPTHAHVREDTTDTTAMADEYADACAKVQVRCYGGGVGQRQPWPRPERFVAAWRAPVPSESRGCGRARRPGHGRVHRLRRDLAACAWRGCLACVVPCRRRCSELQTRSCLWPTRRSRGWTTRSLRRPSRCRQVPCARCRGHGGAALPRCRIPAHLCGQRSTWCPLACRIAGGHPGATTSLHTCRRWSVTWCSASLCRGVGAAGWQARPRRPVRRCGPSAAGRRPPLRSDRRRRGRRQGRPAGHGVCAAGRGQRPARRPAAPRHGAAPVRGAAGGAVQRHGHAALRLG